MFCRRVSVHVVPKETRRRQWVLLELELQWLWLAVWVLGIKPRLPGRAFSTLKLWAPLQSLLSCWPNQWYNGKFYFFQSTEYYDVLLISLMFHLASSFFPFEVSPLIQLYFFFTLQRIPSAICNHFLCLLESEEGFLNLWLVKSVISHWLPFSNFTLIKRKWYSFFFYLLIALDAVCQLAAELSQ